MIIDDIFSIGGPLGAKDDASKWSTGEFKQPAAIDMKLQPILKIFMSHSLIQWLFDILFE